MEIVKAGVSAVVLAVLTCAAVEHERQQQTPPRTSINFDSMAQWLRGMYTEAEFRALAPDQIALQSQQCSCYDEPTRHYPYLVVVLATPRGDLILRPDQRELHVSFVQLALRQGDLYCGVEPGSGCFGRFADVCDFTDHRFGAQLAPYFPTCKSEHD